MTRLVLALALAALGLAPVPAATAAPDPTALGPHRYTRLDYDAGPTVFAPEAAAGADTPMVGELHGEVFLPSGAGRFPVLLFLHGRHSTCALAGEESLGDPCPATPATAPIPSYRGYDYLAANLASHGYLVVSIDANGVNTYDLPDPKAGALARAQLVSRSLDLVASWDAKTGPAGIGDSLRGHVDIKRLGLMGHSRGGEGVTYWIGYNRTRTDGPRYTPSAVFALAPIDAVGVAVSGVPWATLLPRCDGDVYDLEGARIFERSKYDVPNDTAPMFQYVVEGADHNWFNTVWSADDNGGSDGACSTTRDTSIRLSKAQQQQVGLAVVGAFLRRYVGGERAFDRYLTGATAFTPACRAPLKVPCGALVQASYVAPAAQRLVLSRDFHYTATGAADLNSCDTDCPATNYSPGPQATLSWEGRGTVPLYTGRPIDVHRYRALVFRAAANVSSANPQGKPQRPGTHTQDLLVQVWDLAGHTASVRVARYTYALSPPPGDQDRKLVLSDVRVPLSAFRGVNLREVFYVWLVAGVTPRGSLQVADAAFQ